LADPDSPYDESSDYPIPPAVGGLNDDRVRQRAAGIRASNRGDRMAGMCRALARACSATCGSPAAGAAPSAEQQKCTEAEQTGNAMCTEANTAFTAATNMRPSDSAARPPGSPSPGPGGSPSPSPGGQQGTQKPQAAGGSPMDQLAKALQSAMQQQQQQPQPQPNPNNDPTQQNCEANPALAGCPVKKAEDDSWNKKQATAELKDEKDPASAGGDDFNVASGETNNPAYGGNGEQKFGTPATNGTIANGGGQIPGGGGGGAASLGGGTQGNYAAASKAATDIMHGMMSGGYSQMNAAMQMQNGASGGGFSGYGAQGGDGFKPNMDLRQFLPGAKNDPTRKLAGGASSFQIQPQTVNIWSRISERIKARCSQGLLRDCN